MWDLNKPPAPSNDVEVLDHIGAPGKTSSESEDTLSSSATTFLGELLERLQKSDGHDPRAEEFITPKQHLDFAQHDLQIDQLSLPFPHDHRRGMLMNAQLATKLKRNAAGCLKGPEDHHARDDDDTTRGMLHTSPSRKARTGNIVEELHVIAPIGPNGPPSVSIAQPTPQEDQPMVCGVLTSEVNVSVEQVATPQLLSQHQPTPQHTSTQMDEVMEGLRAGASVRRELINIHEGEATVVGSRSRSPTPESSLTPSAAEQGDIDNTPDTTPHLLAHPLHPMPQPNLHQYNDTDRSIWASVPMAAIDLDDAFELAQMSVADLLAGWATNTNHIPVFTAPMQPPTQGLEHPTGMRDDTDTGSSEESSS